MTNRKTKRPIVRLADGVFQPPDDGLPVAVSATEDAVLRAFLSRPAMILPDLADRAGVLEPGKVLARLVTRYDGRFAPAIHRPGRRGGGGYYVRIVGQ
jgi:hypothetical protein